MLGFSVSIKNEAGDSIGYWTDDGQVYSSLEKMVERGLAEVVEKHGGYPNIYRLQYYRLDLLIRFGVYPKTFGFKLDTNHNYKDRDAWVTIELWDQS